MVSFSTGRASLMMEGLLLLERILLVLFML